MNREDIRIILNGWQSSGLVECSMLFNGFSFRFRGRAELIEIGGTEQLTFSTPDEDGFLIIDLDLAESTYFEPKDLPMPSELRSQLPESAQSAGSISFAFQAEEPWRNLVIFLREPSGD